MSQNWLDNWIRPVQNYLTSKNVFDNCPKPFDSNIVLDNCCKKHFDSQTQKYKVDTYKMYVLCVISYFMAQWSLQ